MEVGLKEGSPYTNLLKLMKNQGYNKDTHFLIGQVTSTSPLEINCGLYSLKSGDFYIAEQLTARTDNVTINGTAGTIQYAAPLAVNDFVVVVIDSNTFFVIDKVVLD